MRRLFALFAELIFGSIIGVLAFVGAKIVLGGSDLALQDVGKVVAYMFGVVAGVSLAGEFIGKGGSAFLGFLGALVGALLLRLAGNPGLENANDFQDVVKVAVTSFAIIAPLLATLGYNLGPGRWTKSR